MNEYIHLGYAIAVQAAKDFFRDGYEEQQEIIEDLRSEWMEWLTNGLSIQLADKLEHDPQESKQRLEQMEEELLNEELMRQLAVNP